MLNKTKNINLRKSEDTEIKNLIDSNSEVIFSIMSQLKEEDIILLKELNIIDNDTEQKILTPSEINKLIISKIQKYGILIDDIITKGDKSYVLKIGNINYNLEIKKIENGIVLDELLSSVGVKINKLITVFEYKKLLYLVS